MVDPAICPSCQRPTRSGICHFCAFSAALTGANVPTPIPAGSGFRVEAPDGYELLHELGAGATAVVWLARERRLDRLVALKFISASADRRLIQRLVREGQAVARLRHPHVVAVHAMNAAGRQAYLAMDFLEGGDLRQRLALGRPSPRQSAEWMQQLAGALAHAHANAVLHRDIKPSNVLLSADGEPHLGDFGLAAPLEGGGDLTLPGQVAGTAAYLAPELLAGADRASPRSDLYSLGAVLFECLTGRPPFVGDSTASIFAQLAGAEPPPPRLLRSDIPRDLETICLKCLEKTPARRYASADALREELERFLRGDPIAARPVTFASKALRWCRRHPGTAASAGLAAALLLGLAIGGPLVALRLARARELAAAEAASTRAVTAFLQDDLLAQAAPDQQVDRDLKLRTVLDRAATQIGGRFANQPLVEADVRETLATTYFSLGEYGPARLQWEQVRELRRRHLGADHEKTLRAAAALFDVLRAEGSYAEAEALAVPVIEALQRVLGADHPETLAAMGNLGIVYRYEGKFALAEVLYARVLERQRQLSGPEAPATLITMNNLAGAYRLQGKYAAAETLYATVVSARRRVSGPEHPETLMAMGNLALVKQDLGEYPEAIALGREVLAVRQRVLGPEHPETLTTMNNLALAYGVAGRLAEAEAMFTQTWERQKHVLGPDHAASLLTAYNLATTYRYERKLAQAEQLHIETLAARTRVLGPEHPETLRSMTRLADVYCDEGRLDEAKALFVRARDSGERVLGPTHPYTLKALDSLGHVLLRQGRFADAAAAFRQSLERRSKDSPEGWETGAARTRLGEALAGLGRYEEAEPLLLTGHRILLRQAAKIPAGSRTEISDAADQIARLYAAWNRPDRAEAWQRGLVEAERGR